MLLVFVSGILVGGFGYHLFTATSASAKATPAEFRKHYLGEMRARLKLTGDQVTKLNAILDESRERFHAAHAKIDPEMKKLRAEQTDKIRAILSDDQKVEFEKFRQEREKRMESRKPPGGL